MLEKIGALTVIVVLGFFLFVPESISQRTKLLGPDDIIEKNGFEWLQPDLFEGLTLNEILLVCPNLVCGNGTLNGYDISGWQIAPTDDVAALLYSYFEPYNLPDLAPPEPGDLGWSSGLSPSNCGAMLDLFDDGWRPTEIDYYTGQNSDVVNEQSFGATHRYPFVGFIGTTLVTLNFGVDGNCQSGGTLVAGGPAPPGDLVLETVGIWFYRPKCVGCDCPAN